LNNAIKVIAPVIVLAVGIGIYLTLDWAKPEPEKKVEEPRALSVFVQNVQRADTDLQVNTEGEVRARTEVDIVSQVAGRIVAVTTEFTEGGLVEPGVTLVEIEDLDYKLDLAQAEARMAEAEVGVQTAVATADVAKKQLRNAKDASPLALKQPQVAEARAMLAAAEASLQKARLNLSRTKISLPFQGRLVSIDVNVGQYVSLGTRLARAFSTDTVEVRLPLNDGQLALLNLPIGYVAGSGAELPVVFKARVAGKDQRWQGKLTRLDASIDKNTRMLFGLAVVESPYLLNVSQHQMPLAVGLYVEAEISGRRINDGYAIPREGLRAGNKVYVVNAKGLLEIRDVVVTFSSEREAIISSGLAINEKVVISPVRNAIQGMSLQTLDESLDEPTMAEGS
jgi:RND family efflux transporter MFP subunit